MTNKSKPGPWIYPELEPGIENAPPHVGPGRGIAKPVVGPIFTLPLRNEAPENPRSGPDSTTSGLQWEDFSGRGDPEQRFQIRRLCPCETCEGTGWELLAEATGSWGRHYKSEKRCPECRGEGKTMELVATCATPEAVGVAIVSLGREGEFEECPVGCLDTMGEVGQKWIIRPWLPSPRNASDAGKLLRRRVGRVNR